MARQKKIISKSWSRGKILLEAVCSIIWRHKSSRAKRFLQRIFLASSWEEIKSLRKVGRVFPNSSDSKASAFNAGDPWVRSLGQEDPLEKEMASHSSILAWRIPGTEEPVGYSPWGSKESDTTEWLTYTRKVGRAGKRTMQGHPAGQVDGMMGPLVCVSFAQMSPGTSETMMVLGIKLGHDTKKRKRIGNKCLAWRRQ